MKSLIVMMLTVGAFSAKANDLPFVETMRLAKVLSATNDTHYSKKITITYERKCNERFYGLVQSVVVKHWPSEHEPLPLGIVVGQIPGVTCTGLVKEQQTFEYPTPDILGYRFFAIQPE